jgi:hypothetical protein
MKQIRTECLLRDQKRRFDRRSVAFAVGTRVTSRPPGHRRRSPASCEYRKLKLGRSGDEVRPGWQVT